jgi:hypothetical protein
MKNKLPAQKPVIRSTESYEYAHGDTIFDVTVNHTGDITFIDIIKDSLKRDFELNSNRNFPENA